MGCLLACRSLHEENLNEFRYAKNLTGVEARPVSDSEAARLFELLDRAAANLRDNHLPLALLRVARENPAGEAAVRNAFVAIDPATAPKMAPPTDHMNVDWWHGDTHPHIQLLSKDWASGEDRLTRTMAELGVGPKKQGSKDLVAPSAGSFDLIRELAGISSVSPEEAERAACGINFVAVKSGCVCCCVRARACA